jgi:hypothetical protein
VITSNSTIINKTNNQISLEVIEHKQITIYGVGNTDSGLAQAQKIVSYNQVNGIPTPYANWISNDNTYMNKQ